MLAHQFWTSRGFAIFDVNYSGSAGFGRAYRERLLGAVGHRRRPGLHRRRARAMVEQGRADPERLVIRGGSAGGYTALRALTSTRSSPPGSACTGSVTSRRWPRTPTSSSRATWTGWSDPIRRPGRPTSTARRSPSRPPGGADPAAAGHRGPGRPAGQTEAMAAAARAKGLPVAMIMYPGEGHGFRRAETIRSRRPQAQVYFLGRVLGFTAGRRRTADPDRQPRPS